MSRGVEERVAGLTHAGWLNQEERVWALTAERDQLAEKAVPATEAKPGMRMAEQGVTGAGGASRKKKKNDKLKKRLKAAIQEKHTTLPMTSKKSSVAIQRKKKTPSKKRVAFSKILLDKIKDSQKRLHDPTPDEETAAGIAPNRPFKKRRKKGAAKKASAGTVGFRVIGASTSTRGADRVKPPGQNGKSKITKPKLKKALTKIKQQRMPKASSAGMHTV